MLTQDGQDLRFRAPWVDAMLVLPFSCLLAKGPVGLAPDAQVLGRVGPSLVVGKGTCTWGRLGEVVVHGWVGPVAIWGEVSLQGNSFEVVDGGSCLLQDRHD